MLVRDIQIVQIQASAYYPSGIAEEVQCESHQFLALHVYQCLCWESFIVQVTLNIGDVGLHLMFSIFIQSKLGDEAQNQF